MIRTASRHRVFPRDDESRTCTLPIISQFADIRKVNGLSALITNQGP